MYKLLAVWCFLSSSLKINSEEMFVASMYYVFFAGYVFT